MACFQDQIRDFPWTPDRVTALKKAAKDSFYDKGKTLEEAVNGLSAQTGLKREIILKGLSIKSAGRKLADEMWLKQKNRRVAEQQARQYIASLGQSKFSKTASAIVNAPRRLATVGHFTVFSKTHLSDLALTDPKTYLKTFARSVNLITKDGIAKHEQRMMEMKLDPDYTKAMRAGLDVQPGGGATGAFKGETAQYLGTSKETRSAMAFDELRIARFNLFKDAINKLSPEEQSLTDNLKPIAEVINNQTGSATIRSGLGQRLSKFLFAPKLFPAQVRATFVDPYRAFINGVVSRSKASPGDLVAARMVARRMATLAVAYTGTLAAGVAYSKITGDKKNMPNLTDPGRSDWLRPRLFGHSVPISPTVELLKIPFRMAYVAAKLGPQEAAKVPINYMLGRQNPALAIGEEVLTGREPYQLLSDHARPLPFRGALSTPKAGQYNPKMGMTEFLGTKMPIPVAVVSREFYDEGREQGMSHQDMKAWIHALALGAATGTIGYDAQPVKEYESKAEKKQIPPEQKGWIQRAFKK